MDREVCADNVGPVHTAANAIDTADNRRLMTESFGFI
jgi:hypothetical protein